MLIHEVLFASKCTPTLGPSMTILADANPSTTGSTVSENGSPAMGIGKFIFGSLSAQVSFLRT